MKLTKFFIGILSVLGFAFLFSWSASADKPAVEVITHAGAGGGMIVKNDDD